MAVNLSPVFGVAGQVFDNNGNPLAGGKIYTYAAGTTTNLATYTNSSGSIAHSNPIVLDGAGRVPSGEIWLSDGLSYKFVVEDSASNLIGTYDNLVGINSNFVNYTNSQEIQTATAGQTVFTLTTMQYQPGTNSLSVFVDGVNQYGPGATYAYVETSSTVVTFTSGLHVGAEVKFTTSQINSSAATDASQVSYDPPFTGSVATNVEVKLSETISVWDFGAHPSNSRAANDIAFQDALDYLRDTGKGGTLVIPRGEYDLSANLTLLANVEMDDRAWVIEGNGATLNWANSGLTTGAALEIGATANNFTYREKSFIRINNLRIIGPETQNCTVSGGISFPTEDTDTTGLKLNSALDVVLDNIFIRRFYRGIYAQRCWPITANAVNCDANYIGIQLGSYCTLGTWTGCSIQAAAYCLVLQPDANDDSIGSQTFTNTRFENSLRGITLDQRTSTSGTSANIQNITFIAPRFEQIAYDLLRMGQAWVYSQPDQNGAQRNSAYCQGVNIYGGEWPLPIAGAPQGYVIRSSTNGYVRGCDFVVPIGLYANINGNVILSRIYIEPLSTGGTDSGKTFFPQGNPQVFGDEILFNTNAGAVNFTGVTSTSSGSTTSRLLDDYEEGTWVPTYVPETNAFTSITYDSPQTFGRYTKIGNQVFLMGSIRTDAITIGAATGNLRIGNLPYTATNVNFPIAIGATDAYSSNPPTRGYVRASSKLITLTPTAVSDLGTGSNANEILFSVTYQV
jgi:hypothetical protein